jgi:hypothetical protein
MLLDLPFAQLPSFWSYLCGFATNVLKCSTRDYQSSVLPGLLFVIFISVSCLFYLLMG